MCKFTDIFCKFQILLCRLTWLGVAGMTFQYNFTNLQQPDEREDILRTKINLLANFNPSIITFICEIY